jgi:hypothetical protein
LSGFLSSDQRASLIHLPVSVEERPCWLYSSRRTWSAALPPR